HDGRLPGVALAVDAALAHRVDRVDRPGGAAPRLPLPADPAGGLVAEAGRGAWYPGGVRRPPSDRRALPGARHLVEPCVRHADDCCELEWSALPFRPLRASGDGGPQEDRMTDTGTTAPTVWGLIQGREI